MKDFDPGFPARLTLYPNPEGWTLLRCESNCAQLTLPDMVQDKPITQIGDYAFSSRPPRHPQDETQCLVVPSEGQEISHSASTLEQLVLPQFVKSIGNYAFYGCTKLSHLSLSDALRQVGADAFMNCFSMKELSVAGQLPHMLGLRQLLRELCGELTVSVENLDQPYTLLFPAYEEEHEEMAAPHIFHYHIAGEGYLYRQCFNQDEFQFSEYDAAFALLLKTHSFAFAVQVALSRLCYPVALSQTAKQEYIACLKQHPDLAFSHCLKQRDTRLLSAYLKLNCWDKQSLETACNHARSAGNTQAVGLLLAHLQPSCQQTERARFSL